MELSPEQRSNYKHKNLIFWLGIIKSLVSPIKNTDKILDYGCGYGHFLQLLYEEMPFKTGIGMDRDEESLNEAKNRFSSRKVDWPIEYIASENFRLDNYQNYFDVVFCQEIFWMNQDIKKLGEDLYSLIASNGCCYCTIGSHDQNPLWNYRKQKMEHEGIKVYTHSIDKISAIFSEIGFSVGLRRLPIDGFIMYHSQSTPKNSKSFFELLETTYKHKMLFYFGKNGQVIPPKRIQG